MLPGLLTDLRLSLRALLARPGFALGGILTLAIGIGANTAVFSVIYGVLLRPLPYPEPHRLMLVWETNAERGFDRMSVAPPNLRDWRDGTSVFASLDGFNVTSDVLPQADGGRYVRLARVTPGLMGTLGVPPALGRSFRPDEGSAGAAPVIVLSDAFWREQFGADAGILGRTIALGGGTFEVVGVTRPGFNFPPPVSFEPIKRPEYADAYIPLPIESQTQRTAHNLTVIGRLRPGIDQSAAQDQMSVVAARLEQAYPASNTNWGVRVEPLADAIVGDVRPALLVLLGGVAIVLLLACANTAHLQLARALDRRREMAVRVALGASAGRLVRQLLAEGAALAALGAAAGLLVAFWGVRLLVASAPPDVPRLDEIRLDRWTLAATAASAIIAALLASAAPIGHALRQRSLQSLRDRSVSGASAGRGVRRLLVAGEAALAVVLVTASVLVGQSFLSLRGIDPGFRPADVMLFRLQLPANGYAGPEPRTAFIEQALARLEAMPGVERAGATDAAPLADDRQGTSFVIEGRPPFPAGAEPVMNFSFVSPGYFDALGIDLVAGRTFTAADRADAEPVTIVNETFARRHFAGQEAVGQRVALGFNTQTVRTIVGVVRDERHESLTHELREATYAPLLEFPQRDLSFAVRATGDAAALETGVRGAIGEIDPALAIHDATSLERVVSESMGTTPFAAQLIAAFAGVALLLAIVGVYGVASHAVAARRAEMGVRIALGASRRDIMAVVLGPTTVLAGVGVAVGLAVTALASGTLESLLIGVSALDPATYLLAAAAVLAAALLASWIPALRAARTDPLSSMRLE